MYLSKHCFYACYSLELNGKETGHFIWNMTPLFSTAGHVNYARWRLYYLHIMEVLPDNAQSQFMKREHTIHLSAIFLPLHGQGYGQNMWTEVSYSQIGKGAAGIIVGQSRNMETVTVWAYSLNACCEVVECLDVMLHKSSTDNMRKEEKNPEFHMITLFFKIFCVKNGSFP